MRVALAQISPASAPEGPPQLEKPHSTSPFPTLDQNLVDVIAAVERAVAEKAEVVVFPEYFLQGIANEGRQYLTFPSAHLLAFLQDLAKHHSICIVGSIVHAAREDLAPTPKNSPFAHIPLTTQSRPTKITAAQLEWAKYLEQHPLTPEETAEPTLRNTAFFIDETGKVIGQEYLTPGTEEHQVFDTKWGKAGMQICWDMSHPGASMELAGLGVDIVFAPTYWLATDSEPSLETETVWIMCNAGGDDREGFMGGSGIWAPLRGRVGGCGVGAELKVLDVDVGVLKIREDWSRTQGI
ncbi:hypothetical protein IAT38_008308 [Cryptococcus sp. DSM 104549]